MELSLKRLSALFLLFATSSCIAQMTISGNMTLSGGISFGVSGSSQVATPTFSVASGAVAPGTTSTPSDSTSGATMYYTLTTDGTTPPDPTYNSSTYMPGYGTTTFIAGTAGTSGLTAGNAFVPNFTVYGPINIKLMAAKAGMTDSAIATASYTLTAPTGTALSSCTGVITGTNYLIADVSSTGTCFQIGGNNTTLNLNGHTITYGTANGSLLTGTDATLNGTTAVSCTSCTFTLAMVGLRFYADNYNLGGYQTTGAGRGTNATTIASFTDAQHVTLNHAAPFSATGAEYFVAANPTYGILCDKNGSGGFDCTGSKIYNGTITQSSNASPNSNAITISPLSSSFPQHGNELVSNITFNISQVEAQAFYMYGSNSFGDTLTYNTVNDTVTAIYYRDGLPYPFSFDHGSNKAATSPAETYHDNKVYGSPQGGVYANMTTNEINNFYDMNGTVQYANGFCSFAAAANSVSRGNTCLGFMQGIEEEASTNTIQNNYIAIQMQSPVHDPNHNIPQCELGYGYREKDFNGSASQFNNVLDSNVFYSTSGACGGNTVEFSQTFGGDTTTVSNNLLTLNMNANAPASTSEIYGVAGADMAGVTFSNNTTAITGAFASQGVIAYFLFDQGVNWTLPGLSNPQIVWRQGGTGGLLPNSTATFSGTGTATCTEIPNSGSSSTITLTYNGSPVTCH